MSAKASPKKKIARKKVRKTAAGRKPATRKSRQKRGGAPVIAAMAGPPQPVLLAASPVGSPVPFSTKPSASGNSNGRSTTSGLTGTTQKFDDGSVVTEATEQLTAVRTGSLNSSLSAACRRVMRGDSTVVHQVNYSYRQRVLPDSTLVANVTGLSLAVPSGFQPTAIRSVKATQFGKNDHQDEGTGTPDMGLIQTNSEVFGGSVKISIMAQIFGSNWRQNSKRLGAMIDVLFLPKKRMVRVPLVDVGPGENAPSHAEVDLTWASDQYLGTQGGATVSYRILFPA
jgi:hypothetical protein